MALGVRFTSKIGLHASGRYLPVITGPSVAALVTLITNLHPRAVRLYGPAWHGSDGGWLGDYFGSLGWGEALGVIQGTLRTRL